MPEPAAASSRAVPAPHPLLAGRRSGRAFADRPLAHELLALLFEAARWAPSSFNDQPWSYAIAAREEPEDWRRLFECLTPGNQRWCAAAPVLGLSVARLAFARDGRPNRHAFHDVGMANENLALQAAALGLQAHFLAGFDVERARAALAVPPGHEPVAMFALGWPGDPAALPEDLRAREVAPRQRRPLSDFLFRGRFPGTGGDRLAGSGGST